MPWISLGHPQVPNMQPASVSAPVHVMAHKDDTCSGTLPANAKVLHQQFQSAGVSSQFDQLNGGFTLAGTGNPPINVCDALTFHGFLGIENKAAIEITKRADGILARLDRRFPGNSRPIAGAGAIPAGVFTIDLAPLASDPDGDPITFALPHAISNRGATLTLSGTTVTYTPAATGITDGFVYIASDGKGGVSPGLVTVTVGP